MAAVTIATHQTVTATPTNTIGRTAGLTTALTVGIVRSSSPNQSLSIATHFNINATRTANLYPLVEYFTVVANLTAFITDYVDPGYAPDQQPISATVKFIPRLPTGQIIWIPGQGVVLSTITARFDPDGILRTIIGDVGVQLVANTPILGLTQPLIWDVSFSNVIYARGDRYLQPFGFAAPTTGGGIVDLSLVTKLVPAPGTP